MEGMEKMKKGEASDMFLKGIHEVRTIEQLEKLGSLIALGKRITEKEWGELLSSRWEHSFVPVAGVAFIICIPMNKLGDILADAVRARKTLLENATRVLANIKDLRNGKIMTLLMMKIINIAAATNSVNKLWETGLIQTMFTDEPKVYRVPFLYLSAQSGNPCVDPPVTVGNLRIDCQIYYYSAYNKLLAGLVNDADTEFSRAYILSKGAKDMRRHIVNMMSLSAFLSGVPLPLFHARIAKKYRPTSGNASDIWDLDVTEISYHGIFEKLKYQIHQERARRILIDLSKTTRQVSLEQLTLLCGVSDVESIIAELVSNSRICCAIEDNIVILKDPPILTELEAEVAKVSALMEATSIN